MEAGDAVESGDSMECGDAMELVIEYARVSSEVPPTSTCRRTRPGRLGLRRLQQLAAFARPQRLQQLAGFDTSGAVLTPRCGAIGVVLAPRRRLRRTGVDGRPRRHGANARESMAGRESAPPARELTLLALDSALTPTIRI
jgi:hypothetical protein